MESLVVKVITLQAFFAVLSTATRAPCIPEKCPDVYEPVCDWRGGLYKNSCTFSNYKNCVNLNLVPRTIIKCPDAWAPVCDSDRITHTNSCYFVNYKRCGHPNAKIVSEGPCIESCDYVDCPPTYECYEIEEERIAKCRYKNPSPTPKRTCAPVTCAPNLPDDPVCASDGKTYRNECVLGCHLDILHKGECGPWDV